MPAADDLLRHFYSHLPEPSQPTEVSMKVRALLVGVTYVGQPPEHECFLQGPCNDVVMLGAVLKNIWKLSPDAIRVLTDAEPCSVYKDRIRSPLFPVKPLGASAWLPEGAKSVEEATPTLQNIRDGISWLMEGGMEAGELRVFVFCGLGCQLEDMSLPDGSGYTESLLPSDYWEDDWMRILPVPRLKSLLRLDRTAKNSHVLLFLDCAGGQSALNVAGRVSLKRGRSGGQWNSFQHMLLGGVRDGPVMDVMEGAIYDGVWPLVNVKDRVRLAKYVLPPLSGKLQPRPRYFPFLQLSSVSHSPDFHELKSLISFEVGAGGASGYLLTAGGLDDCVLECQLPALHVRGGRLTSDSSQSVIHGLLSWSLAAAIHKTTYRSMAMTMRHLFSDITETHSAICEDLFPNIKIGTPQLSILDEGCNLDDRIRAPCFLKPTSRKQSSSARDA